jgi:hypothetical protein
VHDVDRIGIGCEAFKAEQRRSVHNPALFRAPPELHCERARCAFELAHVPERCAWNKPISALQPKLRQVITDAPPKTILAVVQVAKHNRSLQDGPNLHSHKAPLLLS